MYLDGWWHLSNDVSGIVEGALGLPITYDFLISINGSNHLIYPDDLQKFGSLIGEVEKKSCAFNFRIISSQGDIKNISGEGKIRYKDVDSFQSSPKNGSDAQVGKANGVLIFPIEGGGEIEQKTLTPGLQQNKELLESVIQLKQLNSRLRELDRAKTEFFSNVSHEFRTPLTLMLGPLGDVLKNVETDHTSVDVQKLKMVYRNAMRLQKLVNTLLDFSRIEVGAVEVFFQPTDLTQFTFDLASNFRSVVERAGLKFVTKSHEIDEPVYVNRELWEKIVLNLISNAFKFTHAGKIEVALRSKKRHVQLHIRDTGIGISLSNQARIFERFKRIEGTNGRTYEGSGIGLALVKKLVEIHGGTIKVTSKEGKGSVFIVSLPKGISHLPSKQIFETREALTPVTLTRSFFEEASGWLPETARKKLSAKRKVNGTRPLVLVADDNADMRLYLEHILSEEFKVIAVENGRGVIELLREGIKPDLILADVMMPVMDGQAMVTEIKNAVETRTIPVILLSARSGEQDKIKGMQLGADDYLTKPFSSRELKAIVNARIQIAHSRNDLEKALRNKNMELGEMVLPEQKN